MAENSKIQWTDHTWNIAVGCKKVDEDCKYCYMYRGSMNGTRYDPREIRKTKTVFDLPLRIKEPSRIFVSSLTDIFLSEIDVFRKDMWDIIEQCPQHTFQILTKRPERILDCIPHPTENRQINWDNIFIGTSVGSHHSINRIRQLIKASLIHPMKTFVSLEPLWAPVYLDETYFSAILPYASTKIPELLQWVIVGGESGNETGKYRYRPCRLDWIDLIIKQCKQYNTPVFVKQLGTHLSKELGLKDRHGGDINEWPEHLRIREFPKS